MITKTPLLASVYIDMSIIGQQAIIPMQGRNTLTLHVEDPAAASGTLEIMRSNVAEGPPLSFSTPLLVTAAGFYPATGAPYNFLGIAYAFIRVIVAGSGQFKITYFAVEDISG